ncbi:WD40-repeat-containing domain protein, partial [Dunaliella salina]
VWDIRDGKCKKTLSGHPGVVLCVAIHSGANLSVSGSQDSSGRWKTHLKVWDLRDGECKMDLTGVKGPVSCVAISPDARFCVTGHWDETVRVWDLEDGECKKTMTGHTGKVTKVVISSDACLCVTGSSKDETLRVWDLENGESKMELSGPEESPASLAISPDDRFCVSRDKDDTVWKWDLATGEQLACFCRYSEGGEQLMALADCWRAGCHPPALEDGPTGNVVAWPGDDGDTIQWRAAGAGSVSASDPAVFYIMPPMSFDGCFRLFYAKSSRSVLFFDEVTCQFVCYQLLV